MKELCIIGAGFGGLSVAHNLCHDKNYKITIFERNDFIGGQASSVLQKCHIEYSWRVFFDKYIHVNKIMSDIFPPSQIKNKSESKLFNGTFKELGPVALSIDDKTMFMKDMHKKSLYEIAEYFNISNVTLAKILFIYSLPQNILEYFYSDISYIDYFGSNELLVMICGPILGQEALRLSLPAAVNATRQFINTSNLKNMSGWRVTNGPPDISIFKPWKKYLENNGVQFIMSTDVTDIHHISDDKIVITYVNNPRRILTHVRNPRRILTPTNNNKTGPKKFVSNDVVISSSLTSSIKLLKQFNNTDTYKNMNKLTGCLQNYFTMNLYFSEELNSAESVETGPIQIHSYILMSMPWMPIIEVKLTNKWKSVIKHDCSKKIKEVWNVGSMDLVKGLLIKKLLKNCSVKEASIETIHQVSTDPLIRTLRTKSGKTFNDVLIGYEVHPYWTDINGKMYTKNPKFSLNASYEKYLIDIRPDDIPKNMYFSAYYCKQNSNNGVSMERSCKTGYDVSQILKMATNGHTNVQ